MIYFCLLFIVYIFANVDIINNNDKRLGWILLLLSLFFLSLFVGFRWNTGSDWDVYFNNYLYEHSRDFEVGYVFLERLFYLNDFDYSYFLLFISTISIFLIFFFLFKKVDCALVAVMFFIANYMLSFMGGNRQIIAIGIIVISNFYIIKRKKFNFLFCIFLACLFHMSSIVYIIAYFFSSKYMEIYKRYILLICCLLFGSFIAPTLISVIFDLFSFLGVTHVVNKLTIYQDVIFNDFSLLSLTKKILMLFLFDFYYRRVSLKENKFFVNLVYNSYYFSVLFDAIVGPINAAFMRASVYFRISEIIIVALIVKSEKSKLNRCVVLLILFILCLRQLYSALNFYPELYIPYNNILY
ncbi:EpsG family protein [Photobacterium damselae subsp. damselae]|uniref:EpsG family protein n=1 Tax=Photobacterium damselae TaxID=38293 RepID=UPI001592E334|nr:EpsG family protein [Photobacterium damselae]NVH52662.1 EpsG family protein [Photobacterium damselae subsp. damselae]NVO81658.1 EpsG family protein [Photobacterium damselae subsp. damselae]